MTQTFDYPNLLTGTRSGDGWTRNEFVTGESVEGGYNRSTGIELYNSNSSEVFLNSPSVVLHKGIDYTLHCFAANTSNMSSSEMWVLDMGKVPDGYNWIGAHTALNTPGPVGGWLDLTFRLDEQARDGVPFYIRIDNNGSTDGEKCLIWVRDVMLTESTEPMAWTPAEGETLVGVGARMSANALDGITPELLNGTTQSGIWYETTAGGDCLRYQLDMPANVDNQTFNIAATVCGGSAGWLSLAIEYVDADGHTNRAMERMDFTTEQARGKVAIVVPSGMSVTALYVSREESQPASRVASIALWQGELILGGSISLDVGTSGDIALDVRAGYR